MRPRQERGPRQVRIWFPLQLLAELRAAGLAVLERSDGYAIAVGKGKPVEVVRVYVESDGTAHARPIALAHGGVEEAKQAAQRAEGRLIRGLRATATTGEAKPLIDAARDAVGQVRGARSRAEQDRELARRLRRSSSSAERSTSVRTVSGGLPSLGKR